MSSRAPPAWRMRWQAAGCVDLGRCPLIQCCNPAQSVWIIQCRSRPLRPWETLRQQPRVTWFCILSVLTKTTFCHSQTKTHILYMSLHTETKSCTFSNTGTINADTNIHTHNAHTCTCYCCLQYMFVLCTFYALWDKTHNTCAWRNHMLSQSSTLEYTLCSSARCIHAGKL